MILICNQHFESQIVLKYFKYCDKINNYGKLQITFLLNKNISE